MKPCGQSDNRHLAVFLCVAFIDFKKVFSAIFGERFAEFIERCIA